MQGDPPSDRGGVEGRSDGTEQRLRVPELQTENRRTTAIELNGRGPRHRLILLCHLPPSLASSCSCGCESSHSVANLRGHRRPADVTVSVLARQADSTAAVNRALALASPRWSSMSAALQICADRVGDPRPAMSGDEPWTDSKIGDVSPDRLRRFQGLGVHLGSDAVAGDHGDPVRHQRRRRAGSVNVDGTYPASSSLKFTPGAAISSIRSRIPGDAKSCRLPFTMRATPPRTRR